MQRISLPYIYELCASLKPLATLSEDATITQSLYALYIAEWGLDAFLNNSVYTVLLKATAAPGASLLRSIRSLTAVEDKDRIMGPSSWGIRNALTQFETVLTAEMNVTPTYLVTKKRGYDIGDLIDRAEVAFPDDFADKVPEAVGDIRQAGKCLAFELSTAAGFHMMRGLELVLRVYYDAVTNGADRPDRYNMGDYLVALEQKECGDDKLIAVLKQIKNLHRNELMHPEATLDLNEALSLWGIVQSAITTMLAALPVRELQLTAEAGS